MAPLSSLSTQIPHGTFLALYSSGEMGIEGLISTAISLFNRHRDGLILMAIIFIFVIYWIYKSNRTNLPRNGTEESMEEFCHRHGISPREKEITCLLLKGKTGPDIGKELFISQNTARNHIHHIYKKLKVSNRVELINKIRAFTTEE